MKDALTTIHREDERCASR